MATPVHPAMGRVPLVVLFGILALHRPSSFGGEPPPAAPPPAPGPALPAAPPAVASVITDAALPSLLQAGPATPMSWTFDDGGSEAGPARLHALSGHWTFAEATEGSAKTTFLLQDRETPPWAVVLAAGPGRAYGDAKITVRFQPVSGVEDASAGIVFRAQGKDDYYLCRANALEDNLRLYVIKGGTRWPMASATVEPPRLGAWHTLELECVGDAFQATLDGRATVKAKDRTFAAGWCGLWTKQDSVTRFDDWTATPRSQPRGAVPTPPPAPAPGPAPAPQPK